MEVDKQFPVVETSRRKYPLDEMDVGDSFYIETDEVRMVGQRIRSSVQFYRKQNPETKYVVRVVDGGLRCWRVK